MRPVRYSSQSEVGSSAKRVSKESKKSNQGHERGRALALMESNLRYHSLNTHEFKFFQGPNNEKIFEAYNLINVF